MQVLTSQVVQSPTRKKIFISHPYPEENVFAEWLAGRLRVEGYDPWVDLDMLRGGEPIWQNVEKTIRNESVRVLFVLSRLSNESQGTLKELNLARKVGQQLGVEDFVIPLAVDDLSSTDYNIEVGELAVVSFYRNWARGLDDLLAKLSRAKIPQSSGPDEARAWRLERLVGVSKLTDKPETLYTNIFHISSVPKVFYSYPRDKVPARVLEEAELPICRSGGCLYSFSGAGGAIHPALSNAQATPQPVVLSRPRGPAANAAPHDAVVALLQVVWEFYLRSRGMSKYLMANERSCYFFPAGLLERDKIAFSTPHHESWRAVVGDRKEARWHFGVSVGFKEFDGAPHLLLRPHVVFSDDGHSPWDSQRRQHAARRALCRNWWNDKWRDLLSATMFFLANGENAVEIHAGSDEPICISRLPTMLEAPFSYQHEPFSVDGAEAVLDFEPETADEDDNEDNEDF